jgi:ribosomal protein S4
MTIENDGMPQASKETIKVAGEQAGQRLDRVLAQAFANQASALSRTRLKALILDGAVSIGARTIRDPGYRVNLGETVTVAVPEPEPAAPGGESIPLEYRVRGRRHHRHRQAGRPRGAPGGGPRHRHAGQRADRALRRQPVRHRRGEAARASCTGSTRTPPG